MDSSKQLSQFNQTIIQVHHTHRNTYFKYNFIHINPFSALYLNFIIPNALPWIRILIFFSIKQTFYILYIYNIILDYSMKNMADKSKVVYIMNNSSVGNLDNSNPNTGSYGTIKKQFSQKENATYPFKSEQIQLAKYEQAQLYLNKMSYRTKQIQPDGSHIFNKFRVFDSNQAFREYGLGIYFYLEFIKAMGFLFIFCAVVSGVQIGYNYQGAGLSSYPSSYVLQILKTSLGNNMDPSVYQLEVQTGCDLAYSIFILIFIFIWRYRSAAIIIENQQDMTLLNPQKYSVAIKGISVYQNTQQIKKFIQTQFQVKVYEVSVVYDFKRKFQDYVDYSELNTQLQMEKLSMMQQNEDNQEGIKKIQQKMEKLAQKLLEQDMEPIHLYFIIHFNTISDVMKFVKTLENYNLVDQLSYKIPRAICCACCINQIPQSLLFRKTDEILLLHRKCGRPQDINWENLDIMKCEKGVRTLFGTICILILLIITSITIAVCSIYVSSSNDCTSYDPNTSLSQAYDPTLTYCYCQSNLVSIFTNSQVAALCASFQKQILISQVLQIVAALISTITNILLTILINSIVKFMKPKNKSEGYETSFIYILFATIINSITLPLLINASIFGAKPIIFFKFINFLHFQNLVSYSDFDRTWYAYVAPYYVNFFLIGILNPWIGLIQTVIVQEIKKYRLKNKQNEIIQKIMNEELASFQFDLPVASASLMLYITFALVYSSSLPILIPISVVILFSHYVCNKCIIINYSRQISINQDINSFIIKFIPFILLIHIAFGIWAYTCSDIFPLSSFQGIMLYFTIFQNSLDRIFYIQYFTIALVIVIGGILIDTTLINFLNWLKNCCSKSMIQIDTQEVNQIGFEKRLQKTNILGSYNIQKNAKYKDTIRIMRKLYKSPRKQKIQLTQQSLINATNPFEISVDKEVKY